MMRLNKHVSSRFDFSCLTEEERGRCYYIQKMPGQIKINTVQTVEIENREFYNSHRKSQIKSFSIVGAPSFNGQAVEPSTA